MFYVSATSKNYSAWINGNKVPVFQLNVEWLIRRHGRGIIIRCFLCTTACMFHNLKQLFLIDWILAVTLTVCLCAVSYRTVYEHSLNFYADIMSKKNMCILTSFM